MPTIHSFLIILLSCLYYLLGCTDITRMTIMQLVLKIHVYKLTYRSTYRIVFIYKPCPNIPIFFSQPFSFIILFFNLFFQSALSYVYGWAPLAGPRSLRSPSLLNQVTHNDVRL